MTNEWFETGHAPPHNERTKPPPPTAVVWLRPTAGNPRDIRPGKNPGIPGVRALTDATDSFTGLHRTVPNQAGYDRPSPCDPGETSLVTRSAGGIAPMTPPRLSVVLLQEAWSGSN